VDFSQPFRALTPTLDGPVLRALAGSQAALTRTQVLRLLDDGSEAGVRKVLKRLVDQGVVIEEHVGTRFTYRANREHILWPAVEILTSAHDRLDERIRARVAEWKIQPLSVELFGSVAAGQSTSESDIDLMIVSPYLDKEADETWEQQLDDLRDSVQRWTGNVCEILVLDPPQLVEAKANGEPALDSTRVSLAGDRIDAMVPSKEIAQLLSKQIMTPELTKGMSQAKAMKTPEMKRLLDQLNKSANAAIFGQRAK